MDNNIIISAGIDKNNYTKAVKDITTILNQLKRGQFTEKDIMMAKEMYNTFINTIEESPVNLINEYLTEKIIGFEAYDERDKIMSKVTKREIVKAFRKIKMDTIFLLEGDKNEED